MSDLLDVLEIDAERIPFKERPALKVIDGSWKEHGEPTETGALAEFLDGAIKRCADPEHGWGLRYPKIVLKRLMQLQRDEWHPAREVSREHRSDRA